MHLIELGQRPQVLLLHPDIDILELGVLLYVGLHAVNVLEVGRVEDDETLLCPDLPPEEEGNDVTQPLDLGEDGVAPGYQGQGDVHGFTRGLHHVNQHWDCVLV